MAERFCDLRKRILRRIRIDLLQEFDRNFERQAFFSGAWQRCRNPAKGSGAVLIGSGALRRSIKARSDSNSVEFYSGLPYAAIHNNGGRIRVTAAMKRFFWAKYYEVSGGIKSRKDGSPGGSRMQQVLSAEAEFYKALALKKVGSVIRIPRRRFLGSSPELERSVNDIVSYTLDEYARDLVNGLKDMEK